MKLDDKVFKYVFYSYQDGDEIIVRFDDESYSEVVERFKEFSLACGFHPNTVKDYLDTE
jgi:hypothetical protein